MDEQKRHHSPNSFHFVEVEGKLIQRPGLGSEEPDAKEFAEAAAASERIRAQEAALESAKAEVRREALELEERAVEAKRLEDARQAEFDRKMAELEEREKAAAEREAEAKRVLESVQQ